MITFPLPNAPRSSDPNGPMAAPASRFRTRKEAGKRSEEVLGKRKRGYVSKGLADEIAQNESFHKLLKSNTTALRKRLSHRLFAQVDRVLSVGGFPGMEADRARAFFGSNGTCRKGSLSRKLFLLKHYRQQ